AGACISGVTCGAVALGGSSVPRTELKLSIKEWIQIELSSLVHESNASLFASLASLLANR
ncbi:MAG TPA: hypothetical protein VMR50_07330, partial [Myxococcota bacterium]|nr:hypothetical protein [Myxococcota bacterium]